MGKSKLKKCPKCGSDMIIEYTEYPSRTMNVEITGGTIAVPRPEILPSSCAGGTNEVSIVYYWRCPECGHSEKESYNSNAHRY